MKRETELVVQVMEGVPDDLRVKLRNRVLELLVERAAAVTEQMKRSAASYGGQLAQVIQLVPQQDP